MLGGLELDCVENPLFILSPLHVQHESLVVWSFAGGRGPVLDFAHGQQKEVSEETKKNYEREREAKKETGSQRKVCEEICSEKTYTQNEGLEEENRQQIEDSTCDASPGAVAEAKGPAIVARASRFGRAIR